MIIQWRSNNINKQFSVGPMLLVQYTAESVGVPVTSLDSRNAYFTQTEVREAVFVRTEIRNADFTKTDAREGIF